MKKSILLAALIVAGFANAKDKPGKARKEASKERTEIKLKSSQKENPQTEPKVQRICTQWYTIEAPCGVTYYLCGNNYWDYHGLHAAMEELNEIKCS